MLYNIGSFNTVLGWVPWNLISRWRLGCRILRKRVGSTPVEGRKKKQDGAEGGAELWFNTNKCLSQSMRNFEIELALQRCLELGQGIQDFILPHWCGYVTDVSCPLRDKWLWVRQFSLSRQSPKMADSWRPSADNFPRSWRTKSFITEGGHWGGVSWTSPHLHHILWRWYCYFSPLTNEKIEAQKH